MSRVSRSILTCICTVTVCAAATLADGTSRTVAISVNDANGQASADAAVEVRTADGLMATAEVNGMVYAVKNVGPKVTIDVIHPDYGSASIEAVLPMVDPLYVEVIFTGQNRAYLAQTTVAELGVFAPRVGHWQLPAPQESGGGCANCIAVGDGVFAGNNAGTAEPDITSCTFNDTTNEWWCYTASCNGTATATTCGSGFDTALSAWDACGGSQ